MMLLEVHGPGFAHRARDMTIRMEHFAALSQFCEAGYVNDFIQSLFNYVTLVLT
jgi:hypothetical protein